MARLLALPAAALACAAAISGCGGGESTSPLDEALAYFPEGAPVVVAAETDPGRYRDAERILGKFPFGARVEERLREMLERGGADYEREVKPLLGNPLVFGVTDVGPAPQAARREVVVALETKDAGKLEDLVRKSAEEAGEKGGATIYEGRTGSFAAVSDDVVVLARERDNLERALDVREGEDHLDEQAFDDALRDLPDGAPVRAYVNAEALVRARPGGAQARRVKWIGALRTLGVTGMAERDRVRVDFDLTTEAGELTDADLPLAPGAAAPRVVRRRGELSLGLRGADRFTRFAEALMRVGRPGRYADLQVAKRRLERRLRIDVDEDLAGQLSDDVSVNLAPGEPPAVRAELEDPRRFDRALGRLARAAPALGGARNEGGLSVRPRGGLYQASQAGDKSIVFGVIGDVFVAAGDAAEARALAAVSPRAVPGAEGALVVTADAERLANAALPLLSDRIGPAAALFGPLFTAPLGELSGSARADKGGVRGRFTLAVD